MDVTILTSKVAKQRAMIEKAIAKKEAEEKDKESEDDKG